MLFFRSEEEVRAWQHERQVPTGEILSLAQLWELSKKWYGNRLSPDFHGRSLEQAQAVFREVGLTAPFWYVE